MDFIEYQNLAARTDKPMEQIQGLTIAAMGMVGEAAEALEHIKKVVAQGHELNRDKLIEETGDCLWYCAKMARILGTTLEDIAKYNILKLRVRYPEGFKREHSINRDTTKEAGATIITNLARFEALKMVAQAAEEVCEELGEQGLRTITKLRYALHGLNAVSAERGQDNE